MVRSPSASLCMVRIGHEISIETNETEKNKGIVSGVQQSVKSRHACLQVNRLKLVLLHPRYGLLLKNIILSILSSQSLDQIDNLRTLRVISFDMLKKRAIRSETI